MLHIVISQSFDENKIFCNAQTNSNTQSESQSSTTTMKTVIDKKPLDSKESKLITKIKHLRSIAIITVNTESSSALANELLTEPETSTTGRGEEMELDAQEQDLPLYNWKRKKYTAAANNYSVV